MLVLDFLRSAHAEIRTVAEYDQAFTAPQMEVLRACYLFLLNVTWGNAENCARLATRASLKMLFKQAS